MKQNVSILIAVVATLATSMPIATAQKVGGPCTYDSYPGKATITKIVKTDASKAQAKISGSAGYEGYEIWFAFTPSKPLPAGPWDERVRKPELFQIGSGWYPGEKYIEKYGIKAGKEYAATLSIIKTGTCSPIGYDLKELSRTDFFETPKKQAAPGEVSWDELKAIIKKGEVKQVSQTHSRLVSVTMADGQTYHATEPVIDEIFKILRETEHQQPVITGQPVMKRAPVLITE